MIDVSMRCAGAVTLLLALGATATAAHAGDDKWYVDARLGVARTDVNASALERDFAKQGVNAEVTDVDNERQGYALALGYLLTEQLSVEVGYLDLGDIELRFSTTTTSFNLADVHPESGDGFTAGVRYQYPLAAGFSAQARAGLFAWEGDYDTHRGSTQVDGDGESAVDAYWGVGVGYALNERIGVDLEYRRFEFNRYPTEFITLGAQWRFGL